MQSSKTEEKESQIKKFQKDLRQANKINKLKRDIVPEFRDIMLSRGRINLSLRNKNNIASTQIETNLENDSLANDLEAFKKFVTEETLTICVKNVRNS